MRVEKKEALDNILDCLTGADGGVSFVKVKTALEETDKRASDGDKAAEEVMMVMVRFSRLIKAFCKWS